MIFNKKNRKNKMRKETIKLREKWICEKWDIYKNTLSMEDLAGIFGMSTANVYRILSTKKDEI